MLAPHTCAQGKFVLDYNVANPTGPPYAATTAHMFDSVWMLAHALRNAKAAQRRANVCCLRTVTVPGLFVCTVCFRLFCCARRKTHNDDSLLLKRTHNSTLNNKQTLLLQEPCAPVNTTFLLEHIRKVSFAGATGPVNFPQGTARNNNRRVRSSVCKRMQASKRNSHASICCACTRVSIPCLRCLYAHSPPPSPSEGKVRQRKVDNVCVLLFSVEKKRKITKQRKHNKPKHTGFGFHGQQHSRGHLRGRGVCRRHQFQARVERPTTHDLVCARLPRMHVWIFFW